MPIGDIIGTGPQPNSIWDEPDGCIEFKRTGSVPVYIVSWDIHCNPDKVPVKYISSHTPKIIPPYNIVSPYTDTLIEVVKTICYSKYGYIYRVERVMFSIDEPDEILDLVVCYSSDGQYLGDNKMANILCRRYGIREFVKTAETRYPACVGFNPVENKWYGWSHRAIYGFGIGSSVKKGDCGYEPRDKHDMFDELVTWYDIGETQDLGELGTCTDALVSYKHDDVHREEYIEYEPCIEGASDDELVETDRSFGPAEVGLTLVVKTTYSNGRKPIINTYFNAYPPTWGKGEWTATTLEDAKEMATNFAEWG